MNIQREIRIFRKRAAALGCEICVCRDVAGLKGVFAALAHFICGFPKVLNVAHISLRHLMHFRLGTSDAEVFGEVILGKEYECFVSFHPQTIVDIGANCGVTSIFYANRYPEATVVAVEPEESNYRALVKNVREYPNIIPLKAALWHADGQVEVFPPWPRWRDWGKWGFRVREGTGCRALTLRTIMKETGIETADILKIDIEGAEKEVFAHCDWMDRVKLLAIELHDRERPGCSDAVDAATSEFVKEQRGLVSFYSRCTDIVAARAAG